MSVLEAQNRVGPYVSSAKAKPQREGFPPSGRDADLRFKKVGALLKLSGREKTIIHVSYMARLLVVLCVIGLLLRLGFC